MIFQSMVTFTISFGSTIQQITFGTISWNESTQYVMHFIIGDVLGTGVVIFLFYKFMQLAVATHQQNNG
jgi:glycerol uptake facilitator-like aquaporin